MMKNKICRIICYVLTVLMVIMGTPLLDSKGYEDNLVEIQAAETLTWPVPGYHDLSRGYSSGHTAIDICNCNGKDVVAARSGTVDTIYKCTTQHYGSLGDCDGFGTGLIIKGTDGRYYIYAHMAGGSIPSNVYKGATVWAGQKIGTVGTTGNSSGPHLHFGIALNASNKWSGDTNPENYAYYDPAEVGFQGFLESCTGDTGAIKLHGWAFDRTDKTRSIEIHVYIGGQAGEAGAERHVISANISRPDVNDAYPGVGNYHGFNARITTAKTGHQSVYMYMLNPNTGKNYFLDSTSVYISDVVPTSVSLNKSSATLTSKGATTTLTATVAPSNATNKSVTWKSSNTSVATVDGNGKVTAVGNGTATITVTTKSGGKTANCNVTVTISTIGEDGWYYTTVLPSDVTSANYDIQYQNIYQKYAASSPGSDWVDTGVDKKEYTKSGSTYEKDSPIQTSDTVQLVEYYYYHYCGPNTAWNDVNFYATNRYVHYDEIHLDKFKVYEYASGVDYENMPYYHLKWNDGSGYDAYCHRYSTGGTCDGSGGEHGERSPYWYKKYVYQNYTVKNLNLYQKTSAWGTTKDSSATKVNIRYRLKPTGVSLNKTSATLTSKGATLSLTATVTPTNAGCKDITWKSSNTSVATVNGKGVVTAVGNGTATITATTVSGGKTATCNVTVSISPTSVSLNKTSATLTKKGETLTLTATVSPSNAANKNVTWKSSNTSVATVDSSGKVTAVGSGTATITVTTNVGAKTATCKVTVDIKNGLYEDKDGNWYYYKDGEIYEEYTGLVVKEADIWFYVEKGKVDFTFDGVARNEEGGLYYVENGKVDFSKKGIYKRGNERYYFNKGKVQEIDTIVKHTNGKWYAIWNGVVALTYDGLASNGKNTYYIENGKVDFTKNGLYKRSGNCYYFKGGKVQFTDTIIKHTNGKWYAIWDGVVDLTYDGIASNGKNTYYIENGKVDFTKEGIHKRSGNFYYFKAGKVQFVDTIIKHTNGNWYAVWDGVVDFNFKGIASNSRGMYYCQKGKVNFNFTGTVEYEGKTYKVVKGKATLVK